MAKRHKLTDEEVVKLFSELDESGVVDPKRGRGRAGHRVKIDPLSEQDPSGSHAGEAINRTAILVILGVLLAIVGMQVVYGVNRRLSTANLSESATASTVEHALATGVEWGNGFTQFPERFMVEEADERTGVVEVSVVDTSSKNELELLSNSQIQAAALATNALLNDKIDRVVYNVYVLVDRQGNYQHDTFFGFWKAKGYRRAMLTFIWSKQESENSSYIDWGLQIIGMDDDTAKQIQKQVNSVSSLIETGSLTQSQVDEEALERQLEQRLHGKEIFRGGPAERTPEDVLPQEGDGSGK